MNSRELYSSDFGTRHSYVFYVRNTFGVALLSCLVSCATPIKTISDSAHYIVLPYQNVHDLGKKLPIPPTGDKSSRQTEALARLLFPENSPKGSDAFVDDKGKFFTRDELESRD